MPDYVGYFCFGHYQDIIYEVKKETIGIMGKTWIYKLYTQKQFIKEHPDCEDSGALTLPYYREMHFISEEINIGMVRHEVRHAFISELGLESATLTLNQYEEIQCTLDQNRWEEMDEVSKAIYENLVLV